MFHRMRTALILGAATLLLGACTGKNHMVATAADTNLALEQSTNEMLLLNIIRANEQKPMYFTGLGEVSMSDTARAGSSFTIPFGQASTPNYTFSPSFTLEARPVFKVQVLDNKEFMNALHTPLTLDNLGLYLGLNWPDEFLFYMFVESVHVNGEDIRNVAYSVGKIGEWFGAGGQSELDRKKAIFDRFKAEVGRMTGPMKIDRVGSKKVPAGPVLSHKTVEQAQLFTQIIAMKDKGLSLVDGCWFKDRIDARETGYAAPNGFFDGIDCARNTDRIYVVLKHVSSKVLSYQVKNRRNQIVDCTVGTSLRSSAARARDPMECRLDKITFRSPQSMLYFLGRVARAYINDGTPKNAKPTGVPGVFARAVPIFAVRKGVSAGGAAISASYEGDTYGVPTDENSFSMMSLNLVSQLIALRKDPKTLPASNLFNVFTN